MSFKFCKKIRPDYSCYVSVVDEPICPMDSPMSVLQTEFNDGFVSRYSDVDILLNNKRLSSLLDSSVLQSYKDNLASKSSVDTSQFSDKQLHSFIISRRSSQLADYQTISRVLDDRSSDLRQQLDHFINVSKKHKDNSKDKKDE